eukprot:9494427-Pyramimonas_sp.AAC.1
MSDVARVRLAEPPSHRFPRPLGLEKSLQHLPASLWGCKGGGKPPWTGGPGPREGRGEGEGGGGGEGGGIERADEEEKKEVVSRAIRCSSSAPLRQNISRPSASRKTKILGPAGLLEMRYLRLRSHPPILLPSPPPLIRLILLRERPAPCGPRCRALVRARRAAAALAGHRHEENHRADLRD